MVNLTVNSILQLCWKKVIEKKLTITSESHSFTFIDFWRTVTIVVLINKNARCSIKIILGQNMNTKLVQMLIIIIMIMTIIVIIRVIFKCHFYREHRPFINKN